MVLLTVLLAVFLVRGPTPSNGQSTQELKGIFDQLKQKQDPTAPGLDGFIIVGTDFYYDPRTGQLTHTGGDGGGDGGGAAEGEANAVEGTAQNEVQEPVPNEEKGAEKPTQVPDQNTASEGVAYGIETNPNGNTGQTGRGDEGVVYGVLKEPTGQSGPNLSQLSSLLGQIGGTEQQSSGAGSGLLNVLSQIGGPGQSVGGGGLPAGLSALLGQTNAQTGQGAGNVPGLNALLSQNGGQASPLHALLGQIRGTGQGVVAPGQLGVPGQSGGAPLSGPIAPGGFLGQGGIFSQSPGFGFFGGGQPSGQQLSVPQLGQFIASMIGRIAGPAPGGQNPSTGPFLGSSQFPAVGTFPVAQPQALQAPTTGQAQQNTAGQTQECKYFCKQPNGKFECCKEGTILPV
ncbi:hypothetical protein Pmani_032059 [Petrolisthes manimaculis]|uniref:Uncharacterized protein n=1 Tax=Petrolisthes manimaculis TaxID=1843537 RepID=A0AAE1TU57_9EUCA|nr:hypothetical protein Pmani_032059 [Petrolisthes manimaculis]